MVTWNPLSPYRPFMVQGQPAHSFRTTEPQKYRRRLRKLLGRVCVLSSRHDCQGLQGHPSFRTCSGPVTSCWPSAGFPFLPDGCPCPLEALKDELLEYCRRPMVVSAKDIHDTVCLYPLLSTFQADVFVKLPQRVRIRSLHTISV
jgi:hypothetical protein